MNDNRKDLRICSIVILALVAFSVLRIIVDLCVNGLAQIQIPDVSQDVANIIVIVMIVLAFLFMLPEIYIGIKGIKEANNPTGARAHIVWALILAILTAIGLISDVANLVQNYNADLLVGTLDIAADVAMYLVYYVVAKRVSKEA